jgi:hypothetical protein
MTMAELQNGGRPPSWRGVIAVVGVLVGVVVGIANGIAEAFPFWVFLLVAAVGLVMVLLARRQRSR